MTGSDPVVDATNRPDVEVTVVMPVGRVDSELALQFDALADQSWIGPWELVVSLNSDDPVQRTGLDELLAARPSISSRVVDSSDVRSASHARNVGARSADGDLLLFCDGDDIADRRWIEAMVAALGKSAAVGGHLEEALLAVPGQEHWRPPATPGALPTFLGQPYLVTANMGLTKEAFELVGAFDTSLVRGEDIAFSWDLFDAGVEELLYVPDGIIHYRHRRGMRAMMHQHYLYGRGFSHLISQRGLPGDSEGTTGVRALKPNGQPVDHKGVPYYLRRGSIAVGRVVGLVEARAQQRQGR